MEILYQNTESIKIAETFGFTWPALITSIFALIFVILMIFGFIEGDLELFSVGIIFVVIFVVVFMGLWSTKPVYKEVTTYEVRIEEDYPYYELTNKYDIIEQKGEILVIREKGWDEI